MSQAILLPTQRSIDVKDQRYFKVRKGGAIAAPRNKARETNRPNAVTKLLPADTIICLGDPNCPLTGGMEHKRAVALVEEHFRSGWLVPCSPTQRDLDHYLTEVSPDGEGDLVEDAPGRTVNPAVSGRAERDPGGALDINEAVAQATQPRVSRVLEARRSGRQGIVQSSEPVQKPESETVQTNGKWTLDPDGIRGKSLEELNAMVVERMTEEELSDFEPFETVEEAIGQLSLDFRQPRLPDSDESGDEKPRVSAG